MNKTIAEKYDELKEIVSDKVDEIFNEAHAIMPTTSGDITPDQVMLLEECQSKILEVLCAQLEQNLHNTTLTKEKVLEKIKTQTTHKIDSDDWNEIVMAAYGGSYEVVAEQEMNNGTVLNVSVPLRKLDEGVLLNNRNMNMDKIRAAKYPQWTINEVAQCLFEDGYLPEGEYEIKSEW